MYFTYIHVRKKVLKAWQLVDWFSAEYECEWRSPEKLRQQLE